MGDLPLLEFLSRAVFAMVGGVWRDAEGRWFEESVGV